MAQTSKAYIDDLLDMSDPLNTSDSQSNVSQYYKGRNVLVTGGSGFLGILLIERLLRCCPGIKRMYVFMKGKKGKSAEERFKEQFDSVIYNRLKEEQPDFTTKVIMIKADFSETNLGLSPEDRKHLLDTNIIFHVAATVRFNDTIRIAANINVKGTKEILLLAREMPNLEAFVHVSTAFSYCVHKLIEEKYYPPPLETNKILTLLDILDDEKLEKITPMLIDGWQNTYVYTKAIAEDTVRQYSIGLPACIVRPSIIITTAKEPVSGWINNVYGATGVVVGTALGLLRTLHCVPENTAEMIPADYVVANIIVAGWNTAKTKDALLNIGNANPDVPEIERTPIYNCVSSAQNPITWEKFMKLNEIYGTRVPSVKVIWYYMLILNRYRFMHEICVIFLHVIPGAIFDVLAFLTGRKPMLLKVYKKIYVFSNVISYFTTHEWQFRNDSVIKLWDSLNTADRQIFDFNVRDMSWEEYLKTMIPGLRTYIAQDSIDTLEQASVRYKKLKAAHYTLLTIGFILLIWAIVTAVNFIISFFL